MSPPPSDTDDEPRVRDLLRQGDGDAGSDEFAAWFERPSFAHLAELAAQLPAPTDAGAGEGDQFAAVRKRRAEVTAQVDPALLAHILRHDPERLLSLPPPLPGLDERRPMLMFDEGRVPAIPEPDGWRQVERSDQLEDDVKTCTPQANLRDLHRPVTEFQIVHEPAFADLPEFEGFGAAARAVREALGADYRRQADDPPAAHQIALAYADRRALMARPWSDAKSKRGKDREAEALRKEAEAVAVALGPEQSP